MAKNGRNIMATEIPITSEIYSKEYFSSKCPGYSEFKNNGLHWVFKKLLKDFTPTKSIILDIFCSSL